MTNPLILIPSRMAAMRLPGKPLADIAGVPMVVCVLKLAQAAGIGEVAVACDGPEIAEAVERAGGKAILTDPALPSGTDRVFAAAQKIDPEKKHDIVINLQGDMPLFDPAILKHGVALMENREVHIGTLAAIASEQERNDPSVVKAVVAGQPVVGGRGRALYFSRSAVPSGDGPLYHHIGVYVFRRAALEKFVGLPPSPLEKREKLEQLRAMEAGMRIDVAVVGAAPIAIDTQEGLEKARRMIKERTT